MASQDTPSRDEIAWWSQKYGRPLTAADVIEINRTLVEFIKLLAEWEKREDGRTGSRPIIGPTQC